MFFRLLRLHFPTTAALFGALGGSRKLGPSRAKL